MKRTFVKERGGHVQGIAHMKGVVFLILVVFVLAVPLLFGQGPYTFTSIDYPGADETRANGINDSGTIVGAFLLPSQNRRAYVLHRGTFTELPAPTPTADRSSARGINDRGMIVEFFHDVSGDHGFLFSTRTTTQLDFPGATGTLAFGANNGGDIVGAFNDAAGVEHGYELAAGVYTQFDPPSSADTVAFGINDRGQIVGGWADFPNGPDLTGVHGFLLYRGRITSYDVPSAVGIGNQLNCINDVGDIVGAFQDSGGTIHGFVLQGGLGGRFVEFDFPGSIYTVPFGINNAGKIVGDYIDVNGAMHGFLAQPIRAQ